MTLASTVADWAVKPLAWILRRAAHRRYFDWWERAGYHLTPVHFYQPIPDTRELREERWRRPSDLGGVALNVDRQLEFLDLFLREFSAEYDELPIDKTPVPHQFYYNNGFFGCVDPEVLYGMIRHFRPRRVIEVGSGFSTLLAAEALRVNASNGEGAGELLTIDPFPNEIIRAGIPGLSELRTSRVQDVPLEVFETLRENDILFIDSSHVVHLDSDVRYQILDILPRLAKGVVVHFHDIFLPNEYPRRWVCDLKRFWNEQYFLQAFLAFNTTFETLWAGSYLHTHHSDRLEAAFASYRRRRTDEAWIGPGSFWLRRVTE